MVEVQKDKKSPTWIFTKTDKEGFHHQLNLDFDEMLELNGQIVRILDNISGYEEDDDEP